MQPWLKFTNYSQKAYWVEGKRDTAKILIDTWVGRREMYVWDRGGQWGGALSLWKGEKGDFLRKVCLCWVLDDEWEFGYWVGEELREKGVPQHWEQHEPRPRGINPHGVFREAMKAGRENKSRLEWPPNKINVMSLNKIKIFKKSRLSSSDNIKYLFYF